MIFLITGKDGTGKGLFALDFVEKKRIEESRPVYYNHIQGLTLPWTELKDAKDWQSVPHGSIVVLDEAQYAYPTMSSGQPVPDYIKQLTEHRHNGLDIFFITQNPMFLHNYVRSLCARHYHLVRVFGKELSKLHRFDSCREDVLKNRKDSIVTDFKYPKNLYGTYESATIHTVKASVPFRYHLRYIIPLVILALIVGSYFALNKASHSKVNTEQVSDISAADNILPNTPISKNESISTDEWVKNQQPRIAAIPHSAPKYDELTKAEFVPLPVACVQSALSCTCYSQQGSKLDTSKEMCEQIVKNGYFVDFPDKYSDVKENQNRQAVPTNTNNPVTIKNPNQFKSSVLVMTEPQSPVTQKPVTLSPVN